MSIYQGEQVTDAYLGRALANQQAAHIGKMAAEKAAYVGAGNTIDGPPPMLTDDILSGLHRTIMNAESTLGFLTELRDRLFGASPEMSGSGSEAMRAEEPSFANQTRDLQRIADTLFGRIVALTSELKSRL